MFNKNQHIANNNTNQHFEKTYPNREFPPTEVFPKPIFDSPKVLVVFPKVEPNNPVPDVFPIRPPGFWAVFPKSDPVVPKVLVPKVPVFCMFPKEKLVFVGWKAEVDVAVDVPNGVCPKLVPNMPGVVGLDVKNPGLDTVLDPKLNPDVVVVPILNEGADLFPNGPTFWFCWVLKLGNVVLLPNVVAWVAGWPNKLVWGVAEDAVKNQFINFKRNLI